MDNPWDSFKDKYPPGHRSRGRDQEHHRVRSVHRSRSAISTAWCTWISLGIKQLTDDPFKGATSGVKKGDRVTCTVTEITTGGLEVATSDGAPGFIRKAELARDRGEQRPDRFAVGDKLDARITNIDSSNRRLTLSVKALEIADEKQAMAEFGSSDSGASLGDILGPAIKKSQTQEDEDGKDAES